jgi:molybdopterin molybdotransferase
VFERLRVAIITTGDEIVPAPASPSAYQVRDSNAPSLRAVLASQGWIDARAPEHAGDEGELPGLLGHACARSDAVVLTGGVSMGHRDPVRGAVESLGAEIVFHGLPQRPGKPMLGAVLRRAGSAPAIPIFGLPGNPVSALVTCTRIVLPALAARAGARRTPAGCIPRFVRIANPDGRTLDLWWHRLVRLAVDGAGQPAAELVDARGSGDIVAAGMSDGFIEQPPAAASALVPFYAWAPA